MCWVNVCFKISDLLLDGACMLLWYVKTCWNCCVFQFYTNFYIISRYYSYVLAVLSIGCVSTVILVTIDRRVFIFIPLLGRIECMRCRLLFPMCAVSVCPSVSLSVTRLNSASLCGGHSVQPLPKYFALLLVLVSDYISYCRHVCK